MNLPHVTDMRNYRQVEFSCEKADSQEFADTCKSCAVRLNVVNGSWFEKIFEQDPIGNVFSCRDSDRRNLPCEFDVTEDIVGVGWLLNPQGFQRSQLPAHAKGDGEIPLLVRI